MTAQVFLPVARSSITMLSFLYLLSCTTRFHGNWSDQCKISPNHGAITGNTVVTVTGINFEGLYQCKFDTTVVPATFVNSSILTCVAPQGVENKRSVPVEVCTSVC